MACTGRREPTKRDLGQEDLGEAKLQRASSVCHHAEGVEIAARTVLAEPRLAGHEAAWDTLVTNSLRFRNHGGRSAGERYRFKQNIYAPP